MNTPLRIIHLSTNADTASAITYILNNAGLAHTIEHVRTREHYIAAVSNMPPDIILADYHPAETATGETSFIIKELKFDAPLILISAMPVDYPAFPLINGVDVDCIINNQLQYLPFVIKKAIESKKANKLVAQKLLYAQEKERNQIGIELHDNICQVLAAAKLYFQSAGEHKDLQDELLQKGQHYIEIAIREIRKISHSLVTPSLGEITLAGAVAELIHDLRQTTSLQIYFNTSNYTPGKITEDNKLMLYRIIQEQFNNIIKHADAKHVNIELYSTQEQLFLHITDDGKGFDVLKQTEGIGLKNIRNRTAFYNGNVKIITAPGEGCSLVICIPLQHSTGILVSSLKKVS